MLKLYATLDANCFTIQTYSTSDSTLKIPKPRLLDKNFYIAFLANTNSFYEVVRALQLRSRSLLWLFQNREAFNRHAKLRTIKKSRKKLYWVKTMN